MGDQTDIPERLDHLTHTGAPDPSRRMRGLEQPQGKKAGKTQNRLGLLRRHLHLTALALVLAVAGIILGYHVVAQHPRLRIDRRCVHRCPQCQREPAGGRRDHRGAGHRQRARSDRRPSGADRSPRLRGGGRRGRGPGRPGERDDRQSRRPDRSAAGPHRSGRKAGGADPSGAHLRTAGERTRRRTSSSEAPAPSRRPSRPRPI